MAKFDKNTNYLIDLINAGNDAYSNLFLLEITKGSTTTYTDLKIRCSGFSWDLPEIKTYQVKYINEWIDLPAPKQDIDRSFSIEFRVDSNFGVYDNLRSLSDFKPEQSTTPIDTPDGVTIKLKTLTSATDTGGTERYIFKKCWVKSVTPLKFDSSSSEPEKVTATFGFLDYEDKFFTIPQASTTPST